MQKVYLAGPITGLNYDGAEDWRRYAKHRLENAGVKALSPLRDQEGLRVLNAITAESKCAVHMSDPMTTPRGLTVRDRHDAMTCDVLLVNLLGATKPSLGTTMEIAWADAVRTPIVVAMEDDGSNPHEHAMINESVGFRTTSLDEAIRITLSILGA